MAWDGRRAIRFTLLQNACYSVVHGSDPARQFSDFCLRGRSRSCLPPSVVERNLADHASTHADEAIAVTATSL